ncbi:MAG: hypothetical protein IJP03_06105 [Christensenellaceae bacterium]|nr:hypothetical protein [Christensenellaceae bacterium]
MKQEFEFEGMRVTVEEVSLPNEEQRVWAQKAARALFLCEQQKSDMIIGKRQNVLPCEVNKNET